MSFAKQSNSRKNHLFFIIICISLLTAYPIDHPQLKNLPPDSDVIEIVDYEKKIIVGYMVLKDGRIIKKISFSTRPNPTQAIQPRSQEPLPESNTNQETPTLPSSKKKQEKISNSLSDTKTTKIKYKRGFIDNDSIEQEQGIEKQATNRIYKNREWNKKKIPHGIKTKVLDIEPN